MSNQQDLQLILASASPRRQKLLQQIGFDPICTGVDIDEQPLPNETPRQLVTRLAAAKANQYLRQWRELQDHARPIVVLAADTVIDLDGQILGKPTDRSAAITALECMASREHQVITGVCVQDTATFCDTATVTTLVRFGPVTLAQAEAYWETGEPADKAGSYAIQGLGAQFVSHLSGSYSNVVGLPLYETSMLLRRAGLSPALSG